MSKIYGPIVDGDEYTDEIRLALAGWKIVGVGHTETYTSDWTKKGKVEGGLTLILERGVETRKVILGYNELGEWLESVEDIQEFK